MRALVVVLQIVLSVVVTASLMPVLLVSMPAAQNQRVGLAIMAGLFVASFVVIALVWPRRKPHAPRSLTPRGRDSTL